MHRETRLILHYANAANKLATNFGPSAAPYLTPPVHRMALHLQANLLQLPDILLPPTIPTYSLYSYISSSTARNILLLTRPIHGTIPTTSLLR
ncbi:hypothetical protein C5167_013734 [Papaver somniferum]|uniref:Uncharacterized protein n=1 Tax=Papaver somniferum TaxID=3469 RepID=A0A4Y7J178_PAPSO|nr:hypothetical protein C5167_013734 [Papaver somniferum]